jgi:histidine kinase
MQEAPMQIPGFEVGERVYESVNSVIHRAVQVADGRPVVIKLLPGDFPTADDVARFRREYEMTQRLTGPGIIEVVDLVRVPNGLAIALEDFGALALSDVLREADLTLAEKLAVGVEAALALARVHAADIVHKDINPANILLHRDSGRVKLIDFGISTELRREPAAAVSPHQLEGTLDYVSPEQTGRTSRPLDYRSDLYSLGCTLYHALSGRPPFEGADALELVHCHLALLPQPLDTVPAPVARIVARLMEKDPEARYQSAEGVARDLDRCRDSLAATGGVEEFQVGADDISDRFSVPERLYGRATEISRLLAAFDAAAGGRAQLCLVAGYSGIGKSALVREVHRPIVERRGYFVSGKFDQFQRDVPYASLVQAFTQLVRRVLSEPADALAAWSERLREAVGINGQVIVDVIPEVERIIGAQPPVGPVAPMEARNRFNLVFEAFVHAFADAAHPLAVFLDDLQWADGSGERGVWHLQSLRPAHLCVVPVRPPGALPGTRRGARALGGRYGVAGSRPNLSPLPLAKPPPARP